MNNFIMPNFSLALPEIFMLVMVCVTLLIEVFTPERLKILTYITVQLTLVAAFFLVLMQYREYPQQLFTFSGNYVVDKLALLVKMFVLVTSFFAFVYARNYIHDRKISRGDYYLLGLLAVLGMLVMGSANTFLTIYLGLELLSLPLYAMVALQRRVKVTSEAAMKYFVMGALASGFLLYGISMIYGMTGSIQISDLAKIMQQVSAGQNNIVLLGLIFILAGLFFKLGAVPFHMWVPDVYDGAPTSVTLFIASAPKIAALGITFRILVEALPSLQVEWNHVLVVVAILSMFFGNLLAIAQRNIKRMLAYSSIAHIGYMLLGLIAGPYSINGYSAAMFYIATYVLVAAGAFGVIAIVSKHGVELDQLDDYRGLNARNPWLAFILLLLMFSMAGVPPTVGFFAKLGLLDALVQAHFVWLAAIALLFSIIGAYYYLRIVMLMYFEEPNAALADDRVTVSPGILLAVSVNGFAALFLGLFPSWLIDLCRVSLG